MKNALLASIVVLSFLSCAAHAATPAPAKGTLTVQESATTPKSSREARRYGAYLGILGDPHPTGIGINLAYNALPFLRASVGYGKVSTGISMSVGGATVSTSDDSLTTLGVAAKFMMPEWNLTPSVTLGYSHLSISGNMAVVDYKANNFYVGAGADWQMDSGFNVGAGLNLSVNSGAPTAPYINVGYFL